MYIMRSVLCVCIHFTLYLTASDAAYNAWQQDRPQEAIPLLFAHANNTQDWVDFYDLGLAAYDNGDFGHAVIWLLEAHSRAPDQTLPLDALRSMQVDVPAGYLQALGPLAWPGTGITGLVIMCFIGFFIIIAFCDTKRRYWACVLSAVLLIVSFPGLIAYSLDSQRQLMATAGESQLFDSSGHSLQSIPEATVVQVIRQHTDSRVLILLNNGVRGYLNSSDCQARP